jgi:quinol monooxygenase YgiN
MSDHVCWMLQMTIAPGKIAELQALMAEMVASTEQEPGTLDYEWHISEDGGTLHLFERYRDSEAALAHMGTFGSKFAGRFFSLLTPTAFTLYGPASQAVRDGLAPMGAVHMPRAAGFSR